MTDDKTNQPSHIAYQVREGKDREDKSHFNRIGAAWPHQDGQGITVELDAVPVNGRVVLRTPQERLEVAREGRRQDRSRDRDIER